MPELEDYLTEIAGLDDTNDTFSDDQNSQQETNTQTDDQQPQREQQPTNQQTTQQDQQAVDQAKQTGTQQNGQPQNKGQDQQPAQAVQDHRPVARHGSGNLLDAAGNVVTADGKVIAKAGRERRDYERFQKVAGDHQASTRELQQTRQQLQEVQFLNNIPRQYNLSNDEVAQGLEIARRMKTGDILGIARDFVALAAAKGVNISQIVGEKAGDAIDMVALRAMLDERFAPITQSQRQEQQESEAHRVARQNYDRFISVNEYADIHGDVIAAIAQKDGVDIQVAYNRTREFAIRNGFDFSIPLGPQIEAAQQRQAQQPQQQQSNQRPMPSSSASTRDSVVQSPAPTFADPNDDWGTIIRRSMNATVN